ncbi:MAG: UDP-N-acetylmuramate dehydrogenase [Leptospiraceae bacterium]|nr:UDP-N-acetylmuramate dehydrogenase [Leptospiraceae bacterium]
MKFEEQVPLADRTSIGLGGRARYFYAADTLEGLKTALREAHKQSLRVHILGGGSNTVFSDNGFDGLVLQMALKGRRVLSTQENTVLIEVAAAENWDQLVEWTGQQGWHGLECLSGIPGQVGAAPIQNIGAYGQEAGERITAVECLDRQTLEILRFSSAECGFSYRQSRFKGSDRDRFVITAITLQLPTDGDVQIRYPELARNISMQAEYSRSADLRTRLALIRRTVLQIRATKSMVLDASDPHSRSCGSWFMNPVLEQSEWQRVRERLASQGIHDLPVYTSNERYKLPAAFLIEAAGFTKGQRLYGVGISPRHALALVNYNGSSAELLELQQTIQQGVFDFCGLQLDVEPNWIS